jgi:hypothetical protein
MRLKDLPAVIMALSALVTSIAGLVKAAKAEVRQEENAIHTAIQEGNEDLKIRDELAKVKEQLERLQQKREAQ